MSDESKLNIQITADASGIEAATAAASATITDMKELVVEATSRMAEAQAAFGASAAAGNQVAKEALASYVAELAAAQVALDKAKASAASGLGSGANYSAVDAEKMQASTAWNREMAAANKAEEARIAAARAAEMAALKADILARSELELAGAEDTVTAAAMRSSLAWNREMAAANMAAEAEITAARAAEMAALKADILARSELELAGSEDVVAAATARSSTAWNREMAAANMAAEAEITEARAAEMAALKADILARSETALAGSEERAAVASYNHAEAMGAARISMGAATGSMGMMESGMARVMASSAIMGPVLAAAVPVAVFAVGVAMAIQFGEAIYKAFDMGGEAARKSQEEVAAVSDTLDHMNAQLAVTLDKELEAKAKSDGKPFNGLKLSADEAALAAANLEEKLDGVIKREEAMLKGMAGTTTQQMFGIKSGTHEEDVMIGEHARHLDEAKDSQAALNESANFGNSLAERHNELLAIQAVRARGMAVGAEANLSYTGYDNLGNAVKRTLDIDHARHVASLGNVQTEIEAVNALITAQEKEHAAIKATMDVQANEPKHNNDKLVEKGEKGELEAWKKTQDENFKAEEAHIKTNHELTRNSLADEVAQLEELGARRRAMQAEYYDRAIKIAGMTPETRTTIPVLKAERGNLSAEGSIENEALNTSVATQADARAREIAKLKASAAASLAAEELKAEEAHSAALRSIHAISNTQAMNEDLGFAKQETQARLDNNEMAMKAAQSAGESEATTVAKLMAERTKILQDGLNHEQSIRDAAAIKADAEQRDALKRALEESKKAGDDKQSQAEKFIEHNERMGYTSGSKAASQKLAAVNQNEKGQTADINLQEAKLGPDAEKEGNANFEEYQKLEQRKIEVARKAADERMRITMQEAERQQQQFQRMFNSMTGPLNTFTDHWLTSGRRMGAAFQQMGDQMAMNFINAEMRMLEKHLAVELQKKLATLEGNAVQVTSTITANAVKEASDTTTAIKSVAKKAADAAAGAWSAVSSIPFVGPVLAPIAAATAWTGVMALAAFEGGTDYIPHQGVAMLHEGEAVATKSEGSKISQLISIAGKGQQGDQGQQGQSTGGDIHYHDHTNLSGIDGSSVAGMYRQHSASARREFNRQLRLSGRTQG